ncbi:sulfotransferase [Leisingera aquaemixtae]|uniref:sulfotransferase n=1 Tax=Leisingera aquaemixtae TaxID=1396826 RepID=UPI001C97E750|nr:sulfotransferase [Leisingera aquaemixtae]MBY6069110.1 sulfotransferase [Leisingera aquaemixtae]
MEKQAGPVLIYIAAFPYSGSTVFSIALGNSPDFLNLGEANFLENDWHDDRQCYCRKTLAECPFWDKVKRQTAAGPDSAPPSLQLENQSQLRFLDSRDLPVPKRLLTTLGVPLHAVFRESDLRDYAGRTATFIRSLSQAFGARAVVDASKNLRRLEALRLYSDLDIRVIVLKRRAPGLLASRLKRAKRRNPWYSSLAAPFYVLWVLYHRFAIRRLTRKMREEEYLEVSYDDFCDAPQALERRIGNWLGTAVSFEISGGNVIDTSNSHAFTGNVRIIKHDERSQGIRLRKSAAPAPGSGMFERLALAVSKWIEI